MGRLILDELVYGVFKPETVARFQEIVRNLRERGCDAVILGCTEIPLILDDTNSPLPTLDSTRLLARAAPRRAVEGAYSANTFPRPGGEAVKQFRLSLVPDHAELALACTRVLSRSGWEDKRMGLQCRF